MKIQKILKTALSAICLAGALAAGSASANTINLGSNGIGYIVPTIIPPSGLDATFLNNMIGVYNGTATSPISGENYFVVAGTSTPAPNLDTVASFNAEVTPSLADGYGSATATLHLGTGGFTYLIAQWDGPGGADAVYYIGGLSGDVTLVNDVPGLGGPNNDTPRSQFGLSGYWTSTGDSSTDTQVPDGGLTVALLGFAVAGIGMARRKFAA